MLGRRIGGPREVVLVIDPAVDDAASDFEGYRESLWDTKHLVLKPGSEPTYWRICPLEVRQKRIADGYKDAEGNPTRAFYEFIVRCGLLGIRNYPLVGDDGTEREAPQPDRKDRGSLGQISSEEWLNGIDLALNDLKMLGTMIWFMSEARPFGLKQSVKPPGHTEQSGTETTGAR